MPEKRDNTLARYRSKRDFRRTPEPAPRLGESDHDGLHSFVVHRHDARRLHYDLRLEMGGVLKSFAIPRGFSYVPEAKHLAVRTEDHPLEYETFEGVIPKGEYGAGTMMIWDSGRYRVLKNADGLAALEEGKLELALYGARLRGEWHLVKTKQGERDWLLFKHRDRYARSDSDPVFPLDLSRTPPARLPRDPRAMEATPGGGPFSHPEWAFELKFTGRRLFAAVEPGRVRFLKPRGGAFDVDLPEIVRDLRRLRAECVLLDGVLVALDDRGRPDARLLARKLASEDTKRLAYYAFDLLHYEDWSLKPSSLLDRKRALASIVPELETVLYVDPVTERGEDLLEVIAGAGLDGVIAKRLDSAYRGGPSKFWRQLPVSGPRRNRSTDVLELLAARPTPRRTTRARLTNRDKVYWPAEGITKGELLDYYDQVAEFLLPHLRDRPVHMLRYPDGIEGKSFFHKNARRQLPEWVETARVKEEEDGREVRYVVCNDRDTLLYLVNLGSIDLHPWMSRRDALDSPDWAVLDLDPTETAFANVVRVARALGKLLHGAGLRPVLKTSGSAGLHIYVPLRRGYGYDQARMFCELVGRLVVRDLGDLATVERSMEKRRGRVYIDYLQNRRGQTVVAPYVVRPVPGATVSTPLHWDQLRTDLDPARFDLRTIHDRLGRVGDLFRGALEDPQDLAAALDALEEAASNR